MIKTKTKLSDCIVGGRWWDFLGKGPEERQFSHRHSGVVVCERPPHENVSSRQPSARISSQRMD